MMRRWAYRFLALSLCLALIQGALALSGGPVAPGHAAISVDISDHIKPAIQAVPAVVESSRAAVQRKPWPSGDDPSFLLMVAAALALLFPLPGRDRTGPASAAVHAWSRRPQGGGRCPTGPPRAA